MGIQTIKFRYEVDDAGRKVLGDVNRRRWAEFVHGEGCDWVALTASSQQEMEPQHAADAAETHD